MPNVQSLTHTEAVGLTTRWGRYLTKIEQRAISEGLRLFKGPSAALEVGCQGGRWSAMLADKGWRLTCTDVDDTTLHSCQTRIPAANCILVKPEDQQIPCATGSAELLLCIEVFPVIDSDWFAAEARRVLRPGGVLVGVFLNRRSLRGLFVLLRNKVAASQCPPYASHLYSHSYIQWKSKLQRLMFEVIFERGFCWFPFPRESNSPLIPLCTVAERALGLQHLSGFSPWVAFVARKTKNKTA
jgi:SAM-dependent methyltransferase